MEKETLQNNPQLENGYTRIANEIIEKLCTFRISGEEWMVLLSILRKTFGYQKKEDKISLSQFHSLTGLAKPNIIRAIKKLQKKNIIIKSDNANIGLYRFNKLFNTWKPLSKKIIVIKSDNGVIKSDNKSLSKVIPTKEKKETITKDIYIREVENFLLYWNTIYSREYKSVESIQTNFSYWRKTYSIEEIKSAARQAKQDVYWSDRITPVILFRRKNPRGEEVDYIGQFLNKEKKFFNPQVGGEKNG